MTDNTILAALEALRDRSFELARSLHGSDEKKASAGHALAVAAHQHLNALLAIEELKQRSVVEAVMERASENPDADNHLKVES